MDHVNVINWCLLPLRLSTVVLKKDIVPFLCECQLLLFYIPLG